MLNSKVDTGSRYICNNNTFKSGNYSSNLLCLQNVYENDKRKVRDTLSSKRKRNAIGSLWEFKMERSFFIKTNQLRKKSH